MQTQTGSASSAELHNQKPPVILQVLPALRGGGVERGTIEIARAIVRAGGKAIVASEAEAEAWMIERQAEDAKSGKKRAKAGRGD